MLRKIISVALITVFLFSCTREPEVSVSAKQFKLLRNTETGIHFVNRIQEDISTKFNLFDYDYFYNGAGVGTADINNDGLQDIFFSANQEENKLYLNKGGLKFEDISEKAGINVNKHWSTGVTFADVNADGYIDIYVSQGGPHAKEQRRNLLYINNQDLTFTESAQQYGLADASISTQSAFFDYDKDGDLDCFVMNETPLYGIEPLQFFQLLRSRKELVYESSCHLYENKGGVFEDVTIQSGVYKPAFGLGLAISDINEDGWLDIYVANDYYLPDNLYINNGEGFFLDQVAERTKQVSFYGMGVDVADINNDLAQDIFVLDMASSDHMRAKTLMASMDVRGFDLLTNQLGFHAQYMFNSLQLNDGSNNFNNASQLGGVAMTDWSWAVLIDDFDNDSYQDTYITNGYRRYALDNDFKNEVTATRKKYRDNVPLEVKAQLYDKMPSEKLSNLMYTTNEDFDFEAVEEKWGLSRPSFSNGAALSDLDNDGDLDLIVNNMDEIAYVFENQNPSKYNYVSIQLQGETSEVFGKVYIYYKGKSQMQEAKRVRGYMSSVDDRVHFGLGETEKVDSIVVQWLDGTRSVVDNVSINQSVRVEKNQGISQEQQSRKGTKYEGYELNHTHVENIFDDFEVETLLPYRQSTMGPKLTLHDETSLLFVGGALGYNGVVYQYDGEQRLVKVAEIDSEEYEDIEGKFFDVENDGDLDLFVISGGNANPPGHHSYLDRLYLNDGKNNFTFKPIAGLDQLASSSGALETLDIDDDGFMEIIVGNRITPQYYPFPASSYVLKNNKGDLRVAEEEIIEGLENFGIVNDIAALDIDGDGRKDLVMAGEWTEVGVFKNTGGTFKNVTHESGLANIRGWWFSVTPTDINADGNPDFIIGNVGRNLKFKASVEKPLKVMANDFDSTGTVDIVLSKKYKGRYVPVRGRECSSGQMPFIKEKFPTYEGFANASVEDIFGSSIAESYVAEANNLNSVLLINNGDGTFNLVDLPWQAQMFPILDAESTDLNNDGIDDVILVGNIYHTEVETPRLDATSGLILYANDGGYLAGSSLNISGNVKSIETKRDRDATHVVVSRNNESLLSYRLD